MTANPSIRPVVTVSPPPRPPKGLSPEARKFWRAVTGAYVLEPHHLSLLEEAVRTLDVVRDAEAAILRDGSYVTGRWGPRAHPAGAVRDRSRALYARLIREIGIDLVPSDSPRLPTRWRPK
jgi:hypothetical protein